MSVRALSPLSVEHAVGERYGAAAQAREAALCCPVSYDPALLRAIPEEVLERDYGCGDPSRYLRSGERVLDLGSGGGKVCFIASQVVGPEGAVIGVDMNEEMLALARRSAPAVTAAVGFSNVRFARARIQDLALDLDAFERYLASSPADSVGAFSRAEAEAERLRRQTPLIPDGSVDVVISNCVLNLVDPSQKARMFDELFRVVRVGGRVVISDIVADEAVPDHLRQDPDLWTGCISGALREDEFLLAFERAGFRGITIASRAADAWRTVEGIEFRSMTIVAWKHGSGPCLDHKDAVVYKGPFREVLDDDGHRLRRGVRTAVCRKTFDVFSQAPYREHVELIEPVVPVAESDARPFPCTGGTLVRDPRDTKGEDYNLTTEAGPCCDGEEGCC